MNNQENIILLDVKNITTKIFQLSIFVTIAVVVPYFGNQLITGSIVNALLFISVIFIGVGPAFLLCLIPSLISIYTGLVPLALAPIIPFIIMGNVLMVLVFSKFSKNNFWVGAIPASIIKFIFIWTAGILVANYVLVGPIAKSLLQIVSWPQLVTSLSGACLAFIFIRSIKKI